MGKQSSAPAFPAPATGAAPLAALGPHVYKPKGCAFGSQTHSMWLPGLVLWTKCGMASLYLSTPKGQTVAFTLCIKALLYSPYSFLTFWSPGNFYDDYVF